MVTRGLVAYPAATLNPTMSCNLSLWTARGTRKQALTGKRTSRSPSSRVSVHGKKGARAANVVLFCDSGGNRDEAANKEPQKQLDWTIGTKYQLEENAAASPERDRHENGTKGTFRWWWPLPAGLRRLNEISHWQMPTARTLVVSATPFLVFQYLSRLLRDFAQ
jgi:hypothetical protein